MGTLAVRNIAQKTLFDHELSGQISDGMWENLNVRDHWQEWCNAEVIVDPENLGRDFWVRYDSYNFTSPKLLEVVKDRMIVTVRLSLAFGADKTETLAGLFGLSGDTTPAIPEYWVDYAAKGVDVYQKRIDLVNTLSLSKIANAARDEGYSEADLLRDLRDLKKIKTMHRKRVNAA